MANEEFIKKYGRHNFYDLINFVEQLLFEYKYKKIIRGYKMQGRKGYVTIYNNGGSIKVQVAFVQKMTREDFTKIEKRVNV